MPPPTAEHSWNLTLFGAYGTSPYLPCYNPKVMNGAALLHGEADIQQLIKRGGYFAGHWLTCLNLFVGHDHQNFILEQRLHP